jgi:hypothetical protein
MRHVGQWLDQAPTLQKGRRPRWWGAALCKHTGSDVRGVAGNFELRRQCGPRAPSKAKAHPHGPRF